MEYRSPARFIAPLALLAVVVAIFVIVGSTTGGGGGEESANGGTRSELSPADRRKRERRRARRRKETYTVRPGDSLQLISERTGVPSQELIRLNPEVDPQALQPGQKIKLR